MGLCEPIGNEIQRVLNDVRDSVSALQAGISSASANWSDEKYSEFAGALRSLSDESVSLFESGESCRRELSAFDAIAEERY